MEYHNDGTIYEIKEEIGNLLSDEVTNSLFGKAEPLGLFYMKCGGEDECGFSDERYLGIDNSTGEAWKKYFPTFKECKLWLQEEQAHNDEERQLRQKNSIFCENMTRNEKYLKIRELMETQTQDCNFQNLPLSEKAKQYINETCIYEWHMACKSVFIFLTCYGRFSRDLHQDKVIDKLFSGRAKTYRNFIDYDGEDTQIYMNRPMRAILYKQWKREYAVLEVYRSDEDFEWQLQKLYRCQTEGTGTEFFKLPGLFPLLHTM